jgi:hypothetical protein
MRLKCQCRSMRNNNGVVQIHLTSNGGEQPAEVFINAPRAALGGDNFRPDSEWIVDITRAIPGTTPPEPR